MNQSRTEIILAEITGDAVTGVEWSDLGSAARVLSTREGLERSLATA